jgi:predicted Zn-dependent protease
MRRLGVRLCSLGLLMTLGLGLVNPLSAQNEGWKTAERLFELSARPVEALGALADKSPQDPWAHYFHGRALAEAKLLREAEAALQRASRLAPEEGFVVGEMAEVVARRGDLERARELFAIARSRSRDASQGEHFRLRAESLATITEVSASRSSSLLIAIFGALLSFAVASLLIWRRLK